MSRVTLARVLLWPVCTALRVLPARWVDALGIALGLGWYRLVPIRRAVARENVRLALKLAPAEAEPVVRGMYRHLGRAFVELLRHGGRDLPPGLIDWQGRDHLSAALARGRGALILTAHLGNWELLVRSGMLLERPVSVVTRRFKAGWAEAVWRALRRGGPTLLPAGASARPTVATLRRGDIVGYVLDQHSPGPKAVRAPFFGRPASTTPDLARLARLTGAAIVPGFTWRCPDGRHVVRFGPPVDTPRLPDRRADIEALTRACLAVVEQAIAEHPEQWLWIHRRWKPAPEARPAASIEKTIVDLPS